MLITCCFVFAWFVFVVKHVLSKQETVRELKRETNNAKLQSVALQSRLQEVTDELHRTDKK